MNIQLKFWLILSTLIYKVFTSYGQIDSEQSLIQELQSINTLGYRSLYNSTNVTDPKFIQKLSSLPNLDLVHEASINHSQIHKFKNYFKDRPNEFLYSEYLTTSSSSGGSDLLNTMIVSALFFGVAPWAIDALSGSNNYSFGTWVGIGAGIGLVYYIIVSLKPNSDSYSINNFQKGNVIAIKLFRNKGI
jgi:hypothetical protein